MLYNRLWRIGFRGRRRRTIWKELVVLDRSPNVVQVCWLRASRIMYSTLLPCYIIIAGICQDRWACAASHCTRASPPRATRCTCWSASAPTCSRTFPLRLCWSRRCVPVCVGTRDFTGRFSPFDLAHKTHTQTHDMIWYVHMYIFCRILEHLQSS